MRGFDGGVAVFFKQLWMLVDFDIYKGFRGGCYGFAVR